ncbi:MAG: WecB/TagA/CpsF family glycosyltransferase [Pseudanabaena sp. ELA607]|jgi:N-acetylglucosaminyldiphosphoundecaprenol N-acetyl-beta-D-mannosaminyltransferase
MSDLNLMQGIRRKILSVGVDSTSYEAATAQILQWAQANGTHYVAIANVHVVMTAEANPFYREILAQADLVTSDGMPLVWGLRQLGAKNQQRVYGPDLMLFCCAALAQHSIPIFLYGATAETLHQLQINLKQRFPNLEIAGSYAPPVFGADYQIIQQQVSFDLPQIYAAGAKVIFIGLGCPKQEQWMAAALEQSVADGRSLGVMIGVGAAFDFHSGQVKQSPRWMMSSGLEWLYRLWQEPRRLWQRYFLNNPLFIIKFGWQLLRYYWHG